MTKYTQDLMEMIEVLACALKATDLRRNKVAIADMLLECLIELNELD